MQKLRIIADITAGKDATVDTCKVYEAQATSVCISSRGHTRHAALPSIYTVGTTLK